MNLSNPREGLRKLRLYIERFILRELRRIQNLKVNFPILLTGLLTLFMGFWLAWYAVKIDMYDDLTHLFFQFNLFFATLLFYAIGFICIRYALNPENFAENQAHLINFTHALNSSEEIQSNLFANTLWTFFYIALSILILVLFTWIYHFLGYYFTVFIVITMPFLFYAVTGKLKDTAILSFLFLFVSILSIYQGHYFAVNIAAAAFIGALLVISIPMLKFTFSGKLNSATHYLITQLRALQSEIYQSVYTDSRVKGVQASIISIVISAFILTEYVVYVLPPYYAHFLLDFIGWIEPLRNEIPYFVFFFYVVILMVVFVMALGEINQFTSQRKISLLGIFLVFVLILPLISAFSVLFAFVLITIGHVTLGVNFVVFIGFFLFPVWVARLFSYILAVLLMAFGAIFINKQLKQPTKP